MSRQDKLTASIDSRGSSAPDEDIMMEVNLRLRLDEIADLEGELLRINARRRPERKELLRLATRIYEARRMRNRVMGDRIFGEPAWDMLLAAYHMPAMGKMLTVSGLCYCSGVPPTTALRWQTKLIEEGLIERGPSLEDLRMTYVHLTDAGRELIERYLVRLRDCDEAGSWKASLISK